MTHDRKLSFDGNDKTYLYEDILRLLATDENKNQSKDPTEENSADSWEQVRDFISTLLPSDETTSDHNGPKMNLVKWVLLAFEDAYRLYSQNTVDSDGEDVIKPPELVRVLVTENMSSSERESLRLNIKRILAKSLNVTGLPKIPIYLSASNRNIMGPAPAIHIGIDYEEVDLIPDASMGATGNRTIRTSRGVLEPTLRQNSTRTRRG
jgi:hypothetical protein